MIGFTLLMIAGSIQTGAATPSCGYLNSNRHYGMTLLDRGMSLGDNGSSHAKASQRISSGFGIDKRQISGEGSQLEANWLGGCASTHLGCPASRRRPLGVASPAGKSGDSRPVRPGARRTEHYAECDIEEISVCLQAGAASEARRRVGGWGLCAMRPLGAMSDSATTREAPPRNGG
jgi:hypothetical protein